MKNKFLEKAKNELKKNKLDAFIFRLSNENLHEFVSKKENVIVELTGFTGDTAELLLYKRKAYLLVDGRFTIQAKREINDSSIKIVELDNYVSSFEFYSKTLMKGDKVGIDVRLISIANFFKLKDIEKSKGIKIVDTKAFLSKEIKSIKKNCFHMSSAPLFMLDNRYVSKTPKEKILSCIKSIKKSPDHAVYITSSEEEIAYITNLRYRFADIDNHGPLFKSFLMLSKKKSTLYIDDYLEDEAAKYIKKSGINVKPYNEFYKDLHKIRNKINCFIDPGINNFHIYKALHLPKDNLIVSPLIKDMSIKGKTEIRNLKKCNIIDGVAITRAIYNLKTNNVYKNEYEVAKMVDKTRRDVGKKNFLCNSFGTIAAYKGNAAICHYIPKKNFSKKISGDGLLLIDSGGNYLFGTTDVTRTISLYKNKKNIPSEIKKHYTLVLNAMLLLASQKFPSGLTGSELDIVARSPLYNEYLDFQHGTGHGIGYISNVHEGPNRIGPGIRKLFFKNIIEEGQLQSNEPGIYIEGKYGIRIENDMLCVMKKSAKYCDFLGFEMITLCPFDKDLIDVKLLDKRVIPYLNAYNKLVYKKLSKYMNTNEKKWLKEQTCL